MISLERSPCPQWLEENLGPKTEEYKRLTALGKKPVPWRAAAVVEALRAATHGKCMYCEGVCGDVAHPAVEHIRPKKHFPDLVLQWENLGWVCPHCNGKKRDYWTDSPDHQLLDPFTDAPEEHIIFSGPYVCPGPNSTRGENTIRKLGLDREPLILSRARRIEEMDVRLRVWLREDDPETKALIEEDIRAAFAVDKEFSAMLKAFAEFRGFPVSETEEGP